MKRIALFALILTYFSIQNLTLAQSASSFENAGDKALKEGQPYNAMLYYLSALENKKKDGILSAKAGIAAAQCQSFLKAESLLQQISDNEKIIKKIPEALYWLGISLYYNDKDTEGKKQLERYLQSSPTQYTKEANLLLQNMNNSTRKTDTTVVLKKEDNKINSEYSDFAPVIKGDTLFYSSLRFNAPKDNHTPPRVFTRPMYSIAKFKSKIYNPLDPKSNRHTAHTSWSPDNQYLVYTECEYDKNDRINCQLFLKSKDKKGKWTTGTPLPTPFNQNGYTSTQPNLGYESQSNQTYLYFVSNIPNGKGGLDLWRCRFENGRFSNLENINELNTSQDETSPFWSDSTQTLFFSSKGYPGLGGFDIFKSKLSERSFQKAQILSQPFNSKFDDLYFISNYGETEGYLASNRPGSFYLDKNNQTCCHDLYHYVNPFPSKKDTIPNPPPSITQEETPPPPVVETVIQPKKTFEKKEVVVSPMPPKEEPVLKEAPPTVIPKEQPTPKPNKVTENPTHLIVEKKEAKTSTPSVELSSLLPIQLFFDNDEPDQDNIHDVTAKHYKETNLKYYQKTEDFVKSQINPIESEKTVHEFFENEVKGGLTKLENFTKVLYQKLKQGEQVEVFIKGFTSPRAATDYNYHLAGRRIVSVKNHFATWKYGVLQKYLHSGALKISERPMGETTVPSDISDDLNDLPASVYDIRASRERRVEIVEVK